MRLSVIATVAAATFTFAGPVLAEDLHSCGAEPALPVMFDDEKATVPEIKAVQKEYMAYQDTNTAYIDCLKAAAKSDAIQGMKKKKRKAAMKKLDKELQQTVDNEQDFAEAFNDTFTSWKEKKMAASQ